MASLARPAFPTGPMWKHEGKIARRRFCNLLDLPSVAADQGDTTALPDLLTRAGNGCLEQMKTFRLDARRELRDPVGITSACTEDKLARVLADSWKEVVLDDCPQPVRC